MASIYTSCAVFVVDLILLIMKWSAHPIVIARDNILASQRGVEIIGLAVFDNVLKLVLHFLGPKDVPGSASDAVTGKPKYRWTYHLRKKFFMRCLTPGAIVILVVMAVLSVVTVLSSYRKRADFLLHWEKIGMASYFFTFVVVETFEFFLVIGLYTFVVKSEVHPEVINVDKILYTIRGELSESTGLILADAILTKRQNFKYKRPIFNQFTDFTQEYLLHKIVYISRYIDILFSILLLIIFVLFCLNGFVGPSQEQSEINTVLSQVFEEQGVRQIHTKEEFWNYVDRIFTKAFSQGSKNDGHVGFNEANEEFLRNATDEMLDEFVEKINFEKFFTSMFLLSNNATLVSETSCMINLVSNKCNCPHIVCEHKLPFFMITFL